MTPDRLPIRGLLLDVDGVLVQSWKPLSGAVETVALLRERGVPFRLVTNTTQLGQAGLAAKLREGGFDVATEEVITASVATGAYLRAVFPGAKCFLLADEQAAEDLAGIEFVKEDADIVVMGDAEDAFTYDNLNHVFRMLMSGASLVAMHRNLYWATDDGLSLDVGYFVAGLEEATGKKATVVGKPSREFFELALESVGVAAAGVAMVGDDAKNDVAAAQSVGMQGVLVRTGKFLPGDAETLPSGATVIDSIADVPGLLG